jgi:hypothetical protein
VEVSVTIPQLVGSNSACESGLELVVHEEVTIRDWRTTLNEEDTWPPSVDQTLA